MRVRTRTSSLGFRIAAIVSTVLLLLTACTSSDKGKDGTAGLTEVSIALSWTPNTDYTGVYVADKLGYFRQQGISLKVIPYASTQPEVLASTGNANFAFTYQAGVAYARAGGKDLVSVFAPNQKGGYVIGVRADRADITSPKDLDGKIYAGFGVPDEIPELRYVIKNAGGTGEFTNVVLDTSAYQAVYSNRADFAIPIETWEVIEAKLANKPLKTFKLTDYGFPEQYSVLIGASQKYLSGNPDLARKFLTAVQQGYSYAADHPREAARILIDANSSVLTNHDLVYESQDALAKGGYLRKEHGQVGVQDPAIWQKYGNFLYSNGLLTDADGKKLTTEPRWDNYFTNEYLPARGS